MTFKHNRKAIFIFLGLVFVLLLVYIGVQILHAESDIQTRKTAMEAGEKVEAYIDKNKSIPSDLRGLGIELPASVRYEKISDKTFQFCEDFIRNNNPSLSKIGLFANLLDNKSSNFIKQNSPNGRYGALTVDDVHQSGIECQTVDYYSLAKG